MSATSVEQLEWHEVRLEELVDPAAPICYGIVLPGLNHEGGVPVVKVKDINRGSVRTEGLLHTAPEIDAQYSRSRLKAGDILLSIRGTVGRLGIVPKELVGANITQDTARLRISCADTRDYVFQILQSDYLQRQIRDQVVGQAVQGINIRDVRKLRLPFPSQIEVQHFVAEFLATSNAAIEKAERLIAAKERRKAWLMAELLTGQTRVRGYTNRWRYRHLGELFQERVETNRGDLPLLSITREDGVVPREDIDRKDTSSADKSKYQRICPGDIGYNTMRMWQGVSALSRYEGIVSPAYTVCIPGPDIDGGFASYLFKLPSVVHLFCRYSQGLTSDTWNLKFHHFAEIKVRIPDVEEQTGIVSILAISDEELAILRKMRDALRRQKRGLMQKLLTGQWRMNAGLEAMSV